MSCATCHLPERGFADGTPLRTGRDGKPLRHHVPSLFNVGWAKSFEWDGNVESLEAQLDRPVISPVEMASSWSGIVSRLSADPDMAARFALTFPRDPAPISEATIKAALTAYERTIIAPLTRFDLWLAGDDTALAPREQEGFALFIGKAGCISCHSGWRLSDGARHDIGLEPPGTGARVHGRSRSTASFKKTPGLRGLVSTAPYMHDGRFATIEAVVAHYLSPRTRTAAGRHPLGSNHETTKARLSAVETRALVAFLRTL